ncbi:hypothetical protein BKA62DRAFT_641670 [Auriculariales sp. MPI-PUGE-AT-0066]|nr:hypothetical protein BKA62DRAFT_641670 [Auriculariales sp. MPI-PUGE-AT-0066]
MSWDTVMVQQDNDTHIGMPCLHYKRSPNFRRAEVKALQDGAVKPNKKYYIGYTLRLSHAAPGLVIFQWKKQDKEAAPKQNIPFHLTFKGAASGTSNLHLEYTTPGSDGSNRSSIWSGTFSTGNDIANVHKLGFVIDTNDSCGGTLEFWLDGSQRLKRSKLCLFTGDTHPKWGIYRGEADAGSSDPNSWHTFNSYVYRVQVSDIRKSDVAEAAGW